MFLVFFAPRPPRVVQLVALLASSGESRGNGTLVLVTSTAGAPAMYQVVPELQNVRDLGKISD